MWTGNVEYITEDFEARLSHSRAIDLRESKMLQIWMKFLLIIVAFTDYVAAQHEEVIPFRNEKSEHTGVPLNNDQVQRLSYLSNISDLNEILNNICVVRVVGTPAHERVENYIKNYMENLEWSIEVDEFEDDSPNLGRLTFKNIIAKLNPNARRYVALACHYDSKYTSEGDFIGATDSAVPCAQMMNLAKVMKSHLEPLKKSDLSLMLIFFDGEEAFESWGPTDSIYGSRHLANKWNAISNTYGNESGITDLDKIDLLVLLDLIGAAESKFSCYFEETVRWYRQLIKAESQLAGLREFENYSYDEPEPTYFEPYLVDVRIEDDHVPFLSKNVPVLHLIPYPFPSFWHTSGDDREAIDIPTIENINKILRVFVAVYFKLNI